MSRWSKRSPEEQAEILRKQQEAQAKAKAEHRWVRPLDGGGILDLVGEKGSAAATACYEAKEIPMPCPNHGWVGSDNYALYMGRPLPGMSRDINMIKGRCRKCQRPLSRAFPSNEEIIIFTAAIMSLKQRGRLVDVRNACEHVQEGS